MNSTDNYVGEHFLPQQGTSSRNTWRGRMTEARLAGSEGMEATRKNGVTKLIVNLVKLNIVYVV